MGMGPGAARHAAWTVMALALLGPGQAVTVHADGHRPDLPRATAGLDLSLDAGRIVPLFGPSRAARATAHALSPAASLPDPRALRGGNDAEDARLRLNLKGFSMMELREQTGASFQMRRLREREWRRPVVSLTLEKRF